MSADPAIRAALEAAAKTWECTCHADDKCDMCVGYAAAAVAAFLRALPPCDVLMDLSGTGLQSTHTLAAAVEEAAR